MNLMEEEFIPNVSKKPKKPEKIILIMIIVIAIAIVITIITIAIMKQNKVVEEPVQYSIDGIEQPSLENVLVINEDGTISVPVKEIAAYFGYESFNGNYINKSENASECYVETNEEVAVFTANSDTLEKINKNTQEKTYYNLDDKVQMQDGKLYATISAIQKAFNVYVDQKENKINIYTMSYLIETYRNIAIENGFADVSINFDDEKAILESLLIVRDSKEKYGVVNVDTYAMVLEAKYDKIEYIPTSNEFLVQSNNKMGIFTAAGKERIKMDYQSIELINQELNYYVVSNDGKYGVINENEEVIVPIYCDSVGIDTRTFEKNNLKNKYVLLDKVIPVKKNDLWGLYDINGQLITQNAYDGLGCTYLKERNSENLIVIPDYKVIVVRKENAYYLMNLNGELLFNGTGFDSIYISTDSGKIEYCLSRNDKIYNALDAIQEWNRKNNINDEEINTEETNEIKLPDSIPDQIYDATANEENAFNIEDIIEQPTTE